MPELIRFGPFELNTSTAELDRNGRKVRLPEQQFRILEMLLSAHGSLVSREEIRKRLWQNDTVVEFDRSINAAIKKLRATLDDSAESPRYVETIPKRGYRIITKVEVPGRNQTSAGAGRIGGGIPNVSMPPRWPVSTSNRLRWLFAPLIVVPGILIPVIVHFGEPSEPPHITNIHQITRDVHNVWFAGIGGRYLYLNSTNQPSAQIAQIEIANGRVTLLAIALSAAAALDVSPDGNSLLVRAANDGKPSLWNVEIGSLKAHLLAADGINGKWSSDGRSLIYSNVNGEILVADRDGASARILLHTEALGVGADARSFSWSPDDSKIRFDATIKDGKSKLFEVSSNGKELHEVLPNWRPLSNQSSGRWTPDGNFYLFLSDPASTIGSPSGSQIWALDERKRFLRDSRSEPVLLTTGPIEWGAPIPSRDGKMVYSVGNMLRGELVRYDAGSERLAPFLGGLSAEFVSFSPDDKMLAYVTYPDGILVTANRDGSNPRQLTGPPLYVTLPRWSPDGSRILFFGSDPRDHSNRAYIVPSSGGDPEPIQPGEKDVQIDPNWSPDGRKIVFSTGGLFNSKSDIRILDLFSQKVAVLPGSTGTFSPRWSPDGQMIIALVAYSSDLKAFTLKTGRWSMLHKGYSGFPCFSHDGRFVYFIGVRPYGVFRVRTLGGNAERVVSLDGFSAGGFYSEWMGLDANDRPLLLRDAGAEDIYGLRLEER